MVKIKTAAAAQDALADRTLAQLVARGSVLPVVAGQAVDDLAFGPGSHDRLVASYAAYVGYPMPDTNKLHKVAKYQALTTGYKDRALKAEFLDQVASFVVELARAEAVDAELLEEALAQAANLTVSQFAGYLGYPRLDRGQDDPLLILANLPLPIYLTTSPFTFIEAALRRAGKEPRSELCQWRPELDRDSAAVGAAGQSAGYEPTPQQPLVYHLFGMDTQPESLVLTEDDHLDFLAAVSQGRGKDQGVDPVHDVIKGALQKSALLLLGFSLSSWTFRALYRGLIKPMPAATLFERYCCVQLVPNEQEKLYLEQYLRKDARFDRVYWGPADAFCREELR